MCEKSTIGMGGINSLFGHSDVTGYKGNKV